VVSVRQPLAPAARQGLASVFNALADRDHPLQELLFREVRQIVASSRFQHLKTSTQRLNFRASSAAMCSSRSPVSTRAL
jgi:hypothetical protein